MAKTIMIETSNLETRGPEDCKIHDHHVIEHGGR